MDRRAFLGTLAGGIVVAPLAAEAQPAGNVHQIGYLNYGSPAESASRVNALRIGLRDHGYVEGKNISLVFRWAETAERLPELAADLVRLKVDLIFAPTSTEVEAVDRRPRRSPSCSLGMPTRSVSATWRALRGPAAISQGYRCSCPRLCPNNSK